MSQKEQQLIEEYLKKHKITKIPENKDKTSMPIKTNSDSISGSML